MKKIIFYFFILCYFYQYANAKSDSFLIQNMEDTSKTLMNHDDLLNSHLNFIGKSNTAIGGYLEGNTNYFSSDGISDGFSMEMRRVNIFLYSSIANNVKFFSEIEFEHGAEEISLETALIDFEINPAFNFRAGILLAPIGAFNQDHDGPKWEFVERPLMFTQIIPSTLSEIGFGIHGKWHVSNKVFFYEGYLVNGLGDGIISNSKGRTFLESGKNPEMFSEDNNGIPMFTGKIGFKYKKNIEIGMSYYGGVYNTYKIDGIKVDEKRKLAIYAIDFKSHLKKAIINAEFAYSIINVPKSLVQLYGNQQWGTYAEIVYPVLKRKFFNYEQVTVNVNFRIE